MTATDTALSVDWLAVCRRAVAGLEQVLADAPTTAERVRETGTLGSGGDRTLLLDAAAEDVVFAQLDAVARDGHRFHAISEERGEVDFGSDHVRVVIDPIDGSLNARRTIPSHSLSIAVASGGSMADVRFGYVYDFGAGEEFIASRGGGAQLDGAPMGVARGGAEKLEVVGVEAAEPEQAVAVLEALAGSVYRVRVVGSLAITGAYVAAGRFEAMLGLRPSRSVDVAAAQLIVREAGGAVAFGELALEEADLGIEARYPIAAACDDDALATVRSAQAAGERV